MPAKLRKAFRLTPEAVAVIESRDKEKYPDEVDFIESLLLDCKEKLSQEDLLKRMEEVVHVSFEEQKKYLLASMNKEDEFYI